MLVTRVEIKVHEDRQIYNLIKKRENLTPTLWNTSLVGLYNGVVSCLERRARAPSSRKTVVPVHLREHRSGTGGLT